MSNLLVEDKKYVKENKILSFLRKIVLINEFGVFVAMIVIAVFFQISTKGLFFISGNLISILRQTSILGIMSVAMTILITSGEFDLSIGSTFAFNAIIMAILITRYNYSVWIAAIVALVGAVVVGLINGLITVKLKIPSFITTLGTMMVIRGLALLVTNGWPISNFPPSIFYGMFGGEYFGIPLQAVWFIVVVIIGYLALQKSKFGISVFATGGNKEAARLSGINTNRIKIICFILTALAATFASFTSVGYLGSVAPTQGVEMEMQAIAASVVGNTALMGGSGYIIGTFLGAIIMSIVKNGLVLMGTNVYFQRAALGLIILVAVIINTLTSRKRV